MIRLLSRLRRRHTDLDARVADARALAEKAGEEVRRSQARQESVQQHVVKPLRRAAEHNQFADLIRRSLTEGNGGKA